MHITPRIGIALEFRESGILVNTPALILPWCDIRMFEHVPFEEHGDNISKCGLLREWSFHRPPHCIHAAGQKPRIDAVPVDPGRDIAS